MLAFIIATFRTIIPRSGALSRAIDRRSVSRAAGARYRAVVVIVAIDERKCMQCTRITRAAPALCLFPSPLRFSLIIDLRKRLNQEITRDRAQLKNFTA